MTSKTMTTDKKIQKIMNDFKLFSLNFIKIVDNHGELIPFKFNDQQKEFINSWDRYNFVLKPRQLGFTTVSLAYCLYMALTNPNTQYLIVSYKGDSARDLFNKIKRMNSNLPRDSFPSLFPKVKRENRDELTFENGSTIVSTTAGSNDELGRGMTLMYVLLSEAAFYDELKGVLTSLEPSLMKTEKAKIVIETTANGFNYAQQLHELAKKGKSKFKAFFFPFFASAYEKQFKYDIELAIKWYKARNKGKRLSADDLNKEEQQLHQIGCSLNMLMWRQYKLSDTDKNTFYQEYPAYDIQAFISTGVSVFDQSKILEQMNHTLPPLTRDELKGELPDSLMEYIGRGLEIYHFPKRGKRYYGGVDVAAGGQGDFSTISIFDDSGEQVASLNRNDIPVYRFSDIVRQLGMYFNYAFYVIERNGFGTSLLERLRKDTDDPYLNLYRHRHFDAKGGSDYKLGFPQTAMTKSQATTDAKEAFETGLIHINCKDTLTQMQTYSDTGKNRTEGHHHDLVISLMMAVVGLKANRYYVQA
ncbi:terminase large subunit domain-containing protein [Paenibacillus bouchesdurhonensis]|uniref:terminase large subunit domain-containing protein n=1 Tax=Paenibacillus bouchesdurhonensis TaxID=1870990 RepID=UPI0018FF3735|nr:terminase family protein [Paenibacillus bouchesdurhonensis]